MSDIHADTDTGLTARQAASSVGEQVRIRRSGANVDVLAYTSWGLHLRYADGTTTWRSPASVEHLPGPEIADWSPAVGIEAL